MPAFQEGFVRAVTVVVTSTTGVHSHSADLAVVVPTDDQLVDRRRTAAIPAGAEVARAALSRGATAGV